ncbi:MAG TPA: ATP synthase subunit I [Candidatus Angelobacter sp.]|nr:ATP synthase subunit I [Candidatus Angelobacter sp.]
MSESSVPQTRSERFYAGALQRIRRFIIVLGIVGLVVCIARYGRVVAAGFLMGAVISYVNHVWLEGVVNALGERITSGQSGERGGIIVARAVLRYAFLAAGAYVIFRVSLAGLFGFLAGICVTIAAVLCEAGTEIYIGLRRGL